METTANKQKGEYKAILGEVENLLSDLEEREYYPDHSRNKLYEVNVKRYNDNFDFEELIKDYSKSLKECIREEFDEDKLNNMYWSWLGFEQEFLINDVLIGRCQISHKEYYDNLKDDIIKGKKTNYPALEKLKTKEEKLKEVDNWDKKDRETESYLDFIDNDSLGFYGRNGGHFCFDTISDNQEELEDLKNALENDEIDLIEAKAILNEVKEREKAIIWLKNEVDEMNKNMDFQNEIEFRINEVIGDYKQEIQAEKEIKQAKALAEKHNYILAKAI